MQAVVCKSYSTPAMTRTRHAHLANVGRHLLAPAACSSTDTADVADVEAVLQRVVGPEEQALLSTAERVFPGGTTGNSCARGVVIAEGRGPHVWDRSGNRYVDLAMGSGPMFIGHGHPAVVAALQRQAAKVGFGGSVALAFQK